MKNLFAAPALAAVFVLAGCASRDGTIDPPVIQIPAQQTPSVGAVQQAILNGCGYVADALPIASLISKFVNTGGVVDILTTIATAACNALAAKKSARLRGSRASVVVNGVRITGHY